MLTFLEWITEAGAEAGKLEVTRTSLDTAREYSKNEFAKYGRDLYAEIPDFDNNYVKIKFRATVGHTKRKDMPVIEPHDILTLQKALKDGSIDVKTPYAPSTNIHNPFPEGLSGKAAEDFLHRGLKIYDGSARDDKIIITKGSVAVSKLIPIQEQIYFDKSVDKLAKYGVKASAKFHTQTIYLVSSDLKILDGHHRWLSAYLVNPSVKVKILKVELSLDKLLPLVLSFGDALGNARNR